MENYFESAETAPRSYADLIDLIVQDARESVEKNETLKERIEGCTAGLERCLAMRDTRIVEFHSELLRMQSITQAMRIQWPKGEQAMKDYWHQRCATAQLEYCYDILRVAHMARTGQLPDDQMRGCSARAVIRYQTLTLKLQQRGEAT